MCVQANGHRTGSTSASKLSDGYDWVPVETDTGWKQVCAACRAHGACKKKKKSISKCGSGQGDVGLFMASDNGPSIKQTPA